MAFTLVPDYHTSTGLILGRNAVSHWLGANLESALWVYTSAIIKIIDRMYQPKPQQSNGDDSEIV